MAVRNGGAQWRMARLSRRIEQWRLAGRQGKRMPAALWEAATELAEELGCYRVSRELGLNYTSLRERAGAGAAEQEAVTPAFAELDLGAVFGSGQTAVQVDIRRADGARMQIRVARADGGAMATIVSAFLGAAS